MDDLEKFIIEHREEFDDRLPTKDVYQRIARKVNPVESNIGARPSMISWLSRAAAFSVILASGIVIGYYVNLGKNNPVVEDQKFIDYVNVEKQYVKDINHKMNVLKTHSVDPQVDQDLMQLDQVFQELKTELYKGKNINNDKIIEALIMNYQVKVDILEKVLSKVQSNESQIELKTLRDDSISI